MPFPTSPLHMHQNLTRCHAHVCAVVRFVCRCVSSFEFLRGRAHSLDKRRKRMDLLTLQPPNGLPLSAVAWDVEALRTLLVEVLIRCKIGPVDLMRVLIGSNASDLPGTPQQIRRASSANVAKPKGSDGLLKDEFVSAIRDTFFASQKSLWKKEVLQVVERSFDTITNLVKGQRFLRRVTVVHFERWLGSGLHATGFRETVPIKRKHGGPTDSSANVQVSHVTDEARQRTTPRAVSLPPSPRSSVQMSRLGPARVLPNCSPLTPAGQHAASSTSVVDGSANYARLKSRGMRKWRTRIQSTKGDLQTQMSMRLQTKGINLTDEERQRFGDDGYVLWTMMRPRGVRQSPRRSPR